MVNVSDKSARDSFAPHSDAAGQDAFNGAPVECVQDCMGAFTRLSLRRK